MVNDKQFSQRHSKQVAGETTFKAKVKQGRCRGWIFARDEEVLKGVGEVQQSLALPLLSRI